MNRPQPLDYATTTPPRAPLPPRPPPLLSAIPAGLGIVACAWLAAAYAVSPRGGHWMIPDLLGEHAAALLAAASFIPGTLASGIMPSVWRRGRRDTWRRVALLTTLLYWVGFICFLFV